jgi:hypothetical membrane protein
VTAPLDAAETRRVWCVVAALAVLVSTIVVVGLMTPGYRIWSDAVSRLGARDEPHRLLARAGLVCYGVLIVIGAHALGDRLPQYRRLLTRLVAGYGIAAIVAGIAPKDPPRTPHTPTSHVHVVATLVGGALLLSAMLLVLRRTHDEVTRRRAFVAFSASVVGVCVFPFTWGSPVYGVIEIALLLTGTIWLVDLAVPFPRASTRKVDDGERAPTPSPSP